MFDHLLSYLQYVLPQHLLSILMGQLADAKQPWLKDFLINRFIKRYKVDLHEAILQNPRDFNSFNDFFIRQLRPESRPIASAENAIVSPADGTVAELGNIQQNQLLQAKQHYFNLQSLLGDDQALAETFFDGAFATIYLAPHNYHRVHMPLSGTLEKTRYIPGKLFSVNRMTTDLVPQLYGRNERFISIFNTQAGKVAVILVGALIVGSMQTVWMSHPVRGKQILTDTFSNNAIHLLKGAELGFFKLGSTVILLFEKNKTIWLPAWQSQSVIQMGQGLGFIN